MSDEIKNTFAATLALLIFFGGIALVLGVILFYIGALGVIWLIQYLPKIIVP